MYANLDHASNFLRMINGEVAGCVASVVKNIKFPAPANGGNVQVNYPFNFHPAGQ